MKLRICGDSIRLRLKISEVERIAASESVVERMHLPDSMLTYSLEVSEDGGFAVTFNDRSLVVTLPKADVEKWARTDEISLLSELPLANAGSLSLLVEKDFTCLEPGHHRDCIDDEDTFPHPSAQ